MSFAIPKEAVKEVESYVNANPMCLLQIPKVRELITIARMNEKELRTFSGDEKRVHDHAITHNVNSLMHDSVFWRPETIFAPLTAIDYIRLAIRQLKLLIIGPRSEAELLTAYAHGFDPGNVKAIDLMSYSDLIELGDMHHLPYEDNAFDVVVAGWVLAYSSDNQRAANEMQRVCKPQGYIAVGCAAEAWDESIANQVSTSAGGILRTSADPERPGKTKTVSRYYSVTQITRLFTGWERIVFSSEPHPAMQHMRSNLICIMRMR